MYFNAFKMKNRFIKRTTNCIPNIYYDRNLTKMHLQAQEIASTFLQENSSLDSILKMDCARRMLEELLAFYVPKDVKSKAYIFL